jgi:alpha-beta hydrolase superfamily lysophospholipase
MPPSASQELVEEFGAGRVTVVRIPHTAHAILVEQPQAVADAMLTWVKALPVVHCR